MNTLTRACPAKLNITLRVLGTRPDGYHEIESLVVRIGLTDTLAVREHEDGCYSLACDLPGLACDGSNLVLRAANAMNKAAGGNHGAEFELTKRIPLGAGLGGGSSDAATTLLLLNELWGAKLPVARLAALAADLGSDVPLFLHGPRCVIRGRGERVDELPPPPALWGALILPEIHCATPQIYAAWDRQAHHPPRPGLDEVLTAFSGADALMEAGFNDLESAAFDTTPALATLAERVEQVSGRAVRLTGSGAALYRLFDEARAAASFAYEVGIQCGVRVDVVTLQTT